MDNNRNIRLRNILETVENIFSDTLDIIVFNNTKFI